MKTNLPLSLPRRRVVLAIGVAAVLVIVAACTGSGKNSGSPSDTTSLPTDSGQPNSEPPISALSQPSEAANTTSGSQASASHSCRTGNPLANVYHPDRLEVISRCRTVTGVVRTVRHETDGDYHIGIRLDPAYAGMINMANTAYQDGNLVTEIIPADEPGCTRGKPPIMPYGTYNYGLCTGADISAPPVGVRVSVTGPYVLDHDHGWLEIHPVWRLASLSRSPSSSGSSTKATSLRITSISPNPVNPGQYITLAAQTSAGASCGITVTYASGHVSSAAGLEAKTASGSGHVSWTWKVGTSTGAGTATARVSCGSKSAQATFQVT